MKIAEHRSKISVTVPDSFVLEVDGLVKQGDYPNRSAAFEAAIGQLLRARLDARIEAEVAKLEREVEKAEAEEGMDDYAALVRE